MGRGLVGVGVWAGALREWEIRDNVFMQGGFSVVRVGRWDACGMLRKD